MKNKGLLIGMAVVGIGFAAAAGFIINNTGKKTVASGRQTSMLYTPDEMVKKYGGEAKSDDKEKQSIQEAQKYIATLLASDPENLTLDPKYVARARAQIMAKRSQRKSSSANDLQWEELGPDNVGGRTRAIWIDPANHNHILAGGVTGGIFVTQNGGLSWTPSPANSTFGVHTISSIVSDADGNIYYGTGESFVYTEANGSGHIGAGIYKSTDGGQSFTVLPSTQPMANSTNQTWAYVNAMAVSPTTNYIYAATEKGLYYSSDVGATWSHVTGGGLTPSDESKPCLDVKVGGTGTVHASINNKYFRSEDGSTFSQYLVTGFPTGNISLIVFAIAPQDPNYVYASIANASDALRGVYRSKDDGYTWEAYSPENSSQFNPLGFQGSYDNAIAVDPQNKDRVYLGGQFSLMAGGNDIGWNTVAFWYPSDANNPYYVHADMHTIVFDPTDPNVMYVGSDGGINKTIDAGDNQPLFTTRNKGYNVTQFYHMDASSTGELLAGAQDNGTNYIDLQGNTRQSGTEINGGDGGDVAISRFNHNALFAETPNGDLRRSSDKGKNFGAFFDVYAAGFGGGPGSNNYAKFIAPMHLWERDDSTSMFFYGIIGRFLLTKSATDFSILPTWFAISTSGNPTAFASTPGGTFFIATDNGSVYRLTGLLSAHFNDTTNAVTGYTLTKLPTSAFSGRYITGLAIDPSDTAHIVVSLSQYGYNNYVFESLNALDVTGVSFSNIQGDLPQMPVYTVAIDYYNPNNIILGTEFGIWMTDQGHGSSNNPTWTEQNQGLSSVTIYQLVQRPLYNDNCQVLYAGTYARGMFRTTTLTSNNTTGCNLVSGLSNPTAPLTVSELNLYPNPTVDRALLDINLEKAVNVDVRVIDMMGRVYQDKNYGQMSGKQHLELDVSKLSAGNYIVSVQTGDKNTSRSMVVMK